GHPYHIVRSVLGWNQPLRDGLRSEEQNLLDRLDVKQLELAERQQIEREVARLKALQRRIWLYLSVDGRIASLDQHIKYSYVNGVFERSRIERNGSTLKFSQALAR